MMKEKIIAIDDQPENLQMLIEVLKQNYSVVAATSGEKALLLANKTPKASVILLDVSMPNMDGFEVIEQLKASPDTADIPVIFVTGRNDESDFAKGIALGAYDFVIKPVSPTLLLRRISHCLSAHK